MAKGKSQNSPRKGGYSGKKSDNTLTYVLALVGVGAALYFVSTSGSEGGGSAAVSYDNDLPWLKSTKTKCESCKVVVTSSVAAVVKQRDRKLKKIKSMGGEASELELSAEDAMQNMCLKFQLKWTLRQTTLSMGGDEFPKKFLDDFPRACRAMLGNADINDAILRSLQGEDGMESTDMGIMNTAVLRYSSICVDAQLCSDAEIEEDNIKYDEIYTPPKEDTMPKTGQQKSGRKKPTGLPKVNEDYETNDSDYDDLDINIVEFEEPDVGADEI